MRLTSCSWFLTAACRTGMACINMQRRLSSTLSLATCFSRVRPGAARAQISRVVPLGSAARFGAAHRAVNQAMHSMPTTVCVEFLSEKCRGFTSDPMDAFFSIAIPHGPASRAPRWQEGGGGSGRFRQGVLDYKTIGVMCV